MFTFELHWHHTINNWSYSHANTETNIIPVSTDRQPVAEELIGNIELVILCIFPDTLKVFQLDTQDHVFALRQQMDMVIAQPELTSTAEEKVET